MTHSSGGFNEPQHPKTPDCKSDRTGEAADAAEILAATGALHCASLAASRCAPRSICFFYFCFCFSMSKYSEHIERDLAKGRNF